MNSITSSFLKTTTLQIALGTTCLLSIITPSTHAAQFNVLNYGAVGDGVSDDTAAINSAISACIAATGTGNEVYIPSGTYRLGSAPRNNSSILIFNANGITVRGETTTVLISDNPGWACLFLYNSSNVTLQTLTFDRKERTFTQGTITAIDPVAKSCDVTLDPGYPEADSTYLAPMKQMRVFTYPDSETYQQDIWAPSIAARTKLGTGLWRFNLGTAMPAIMNGKKFVIWEGLNRGNGIVSVNCGDCLIQDVNYWGRGANAGLYIVDSKAAMTFRRVKIDVPPGSTDMMSCAGGGQVVNSRGAIVYDDCDINKVDDDGADVFTVYRRVLSQVDSRTIVVESTVNYLVGDTMAIMDWDLKQERSSAIITAVVVSTDGSQRTLTFDRDVTILRAGTGGGTDHEASILDGIDRVIDYSMACTSVTFTNCRMQSQRARPINLKGQNALIENCTFHGCDAPAINAGPEFYFPEGPAIHGLTIRNNRFVNCNSSNIYLSELDTRVLSHSRDNQNVLIEGNTFTNYAAHGVTIDWYHLGSAIYVSNSNGVTIQNNDFSQPAALASQNVLRLYVQESDNVTINPNNKGLPEPIVLGSILREYWSGVGGTSVSAIPLGTSPSGSSVQTRFESPINFAKNYGARMRGYLVPPVTGTYTFWIAADDSGELWLSTDDLSINKQKIAFTTTATGNRQWTNNASQKSVAINLIANKAYYIEALQKQGGNRDNLAVGWSKPGDSTSTASEVIPGSVLAQYIRDGSILYDYWNNLTGTAISSIPIGTAPDGTYLLNNNLEGLMNWADNYGSQTSGYLVPPTTGSYTFWLAGDDTAELWLSTDATAASRQKIAFTSVATSNRNWTASSTQKSAAISLVAGKFYYLQVLQKEGGGGDHYAVGWARPGEVTTAPSEVVPGSALAMAPRTGYVLYDLWTNISGTTVASIPVNTLPGNTSLRTSMEGPSNRGDLYGARLRGLLVAPTTGSYTFWIASDDSSELWLSTNATSTGKVKIAYVNGATGVRQWGAFASQKSAVISLVAGQSYYIEALHKEGGGYDNLAVGWSKPGESTATASEVIPGSVLKLPLSSE